MTRIPIIGLAAGGTGGHMFPAESLAQEAARRGWRVVLFTDARGNRFADNFPAERVVELAAASPHTAGIGNKLSAARALLMGVLQARNAIRQYKVRLMVGFGGYPSVPAMLAARFRRMPVAIHEQNAVLGRANRLCAGQARFIAHGFSKLQRVPKGIKGTQIHTGNPVRDDIRDFANMPYLSDSSGILNILVFGGSQGASLFTDVVPDALRRLPTSLRARLHVVQQVQERDIDAIQQAYTAAGITAELAPFFQNIARRLAQADIVIGRAGASTVTEIATIGRPSILVPLAIAMDDHQAGNAETLVSAGAAVMIREAQFTPSMLADQMAELLSDEAARARMATLAGRAMLHNAAHHLADLVAQQLLI